MNIRVLKTVLLAEQRDFHHDVRERLGKSLDEKTMKVIETLLDLEERHLYVVLTVLTGEEMRKELREISLS